MEIFKDIKGYEGLYQIGSNGTVKSLNYHRTGIERVLKYGKHYKGYLNVALCKEGKMKTFKVHRLVAEAFIPNPDNLPQVNHKNEVKTDNRVENLEWCSASYNMNYNDGQKRRGVKKINGNRSKKVYQYTLDGDYIATYPSVNEIERQWGYRIGNIWSCCTGRYKSAYGYKWSYNLY